MLRPLWAWVESAVSRFISVGVPIPSRSEYDIPWILRKTASRTPVPKPAEDFAAKYCPVTEKPKPTAPSRTIRQTIRIT